MKVTAEGLALIRHFEGFRNKAYRDAVGVWTIGYGHTGMAVPPAVSPGMTISDAEGIKILERDVDVFARGVSRSVTAALTDPQFSALVSFAYNVGLGNFEKSSVLKAVNAADFAAVPRRLNLWIKAGGRILPGLVKRRAAEGALFAQLDDQSATTPARPDIPRGKPAVASRTLWAALVAAFAAAAQAALAPRTIFILLAVAALIAAAVIVFERYRKLIEEAL